MCEAIKSTFIIKMFTGKHYHSSSRKSLYIGMRRVNSCMCGIFIRHRHIRAVDWCHAAPHRPANSYIRLLINKRSQQRHSRLTKNKIAWLRRRTRHFPQTTVLVGWLIRRSHFVRDAGSSIDYCQYCTIILRFQLYLDSSDIVIFAKLI